MTTDAETPEIEISSFSAPSAADIARLERLSEGRRKAVMAREIRKGIEGGISQMTMDGAWAEAMGRATARAEGPDDLYQPVS